MMKVVIELDRACGMMDCTSQELNLHLVITLTKYMKSLNNHKRLVYKLTPEWEGVYFQNRRIARWN